MTLSLTAQAEFKETVEERNERCYRIANYHYDALYRRHELSVSEALQEPDADSLILLYDVDRQSPENLERFAQDFANGIFDLCVQGRNFTLD